MVVADQEEERSPCATAYTPSRLTLTMSLVLPGEHVPAQHVNLKLGPGLLQSSSTQGQAAIVSTRAGEVMNNPKGNKWWIEGNSRRVSTLARVAQLNMLLKGCKTVHSCPTRVRSGGGHLAKW